MSQHFYKTMHQGRPVEVLIGWDRPLQGFFLVVQRIDARGGEDDYVYSNLDDESLESSHPADLAPFRDRLASLGITLPARVIDEVLRDQAGNIGNKVVHHT